MASFTMVFLILMMVGIIIIFFAATLYKENNSLDTDFNKLNLFIEKKDDLVSTIEEADDAIEQLNAISKNIFEEQEQKYKELLYLYQSIDEKKYELLNSHDNREYLINDNNIDSADSIQIEKREEDKKIVFEKNSKKKQIMELNEMGMSIVQIAKQLNIGQGEVGLVLELKKRGDYFEQ